MEAGTKVLRDQEMVEMMRGFLSEEIARLDSIFGLIDVSLNEKAEAFRRSMMVKEIIRLVEEI